jgi:hypothetical protein
MNALRAVGGGIGCAVFAGMGAFVGSELGEKRGGGTLDSAVGGAIVGSAVGALLVGALVGANSGRETTADELIRAITSRSFP